jgi:hypothetical protein
LITLIEEKKGIEMKFKLFLCISLLFLSLGVSAYPQLDLKFTSDIVIGPSSPKPGDSVKFTVSFKSQGAQAANVQIIGKIDNVQKFTRTFDHMAADETQMVFFSWSATAGNHKITFKLDPLNVAHDTNADNNVIEKQFEVKSSISIMSDKMKIARNNLPLIKPDLIIEKVTMVPLEEPKCDKKWRMWVYIKNQGLRKFYEPFKTVVNIQGALAIDKELTFAQNQPQEASFYYDWYVFDKPYLRIVTDYYNVIDESDESNNRLFPEIRCEK